MEPPPIRINPQTAEVAPHPHDRRRVVPQHFRALFVAVPDKEWPITAELEITVSDSGEAACISAQVWVAPPEDPEDTDAPDLTGDLMRLPMSRLKSAALDAAAVEPKLPAGGYVTEEVRIPGAGGGLRRKRTRIKDEDLKRVADAYRAAKGRRLPVKQNVAYAMGCSESNAARFIRRARDAGFIEEPPQPGRPKKEDS